MKAATVLNGSMPLRGPLPSHRPVQVIVVVATPPDDSRRFLWVFTLANFVLALLLARTRYGPKARLVVMGCTENPPAFNLVRV